jgi:hypothetical protein
MSNETQTHQDFVAAAQNMMTSFTEYHNTKVAKLVKEGMSKACACDVLYLRGRSRWTEQLEAKLIEEHKLLKPDECIEIMSWPKDFNKTKEL